MCRPAFVAGRHRNLTPRAARRSPHVKSSPPGEPGIGSALLHPDRVRCDERDGVLLEEGHRRQLLLDQLAGRGV
jgi:hypothetical protein